MPHRLPMISGNLRPVNGHGLVPDSGLLNFATIRQKIAKPTRQKIPFCAPPADWTGGTVQIHRRFLYVYVMTSGICYFR